MKPPAYIPPALYPESAGPDNVPAFVSERAGKRVLVFHNGGATHANAQRCIQRYTKKGWRIEIVATKEDLLMPLSIPVTRRAA